MEGGVGLEFLWARVLRQFRIREHSEPGFLIKEETTCRSVAMPCGPPEATLLALLTYDIIMAALALEWNCFSLG